MKGITNHESKTPLVPRRSRAICVWQRVGGPHAYQHEVRRCEGEQGHRHARRAEREKHPDAVRRLQDARNPGAALAGDRLKGE